MGEGTRTRRRVTELFPLTLLSLALKLGFNTRDTTPYPARTKSS